MPDNSDYFDFEEDIHDFDEDGFEARVWNLLVLINPGDEELALQQFNRWRGTWPRTGSRWRQTVTGCRPCSRPLPGSPVSRWNVMIWIRCSRR